MRAVAVPRKSPGEPSDAYLGLLYPTEDFKVFGCAARPTPVYSAAGPQYGPDWLSLPGRCPVSQALAALARPPGRCVASQALGSSAAAFNRVVHRNVPLHVSAKQVMPHGRERMDAHAPE